LPAAEFWERYQKASSRSSVAAIPLVVLAPALVAAEVLQCGFVERIQRGGEFKWVQLDFSRNLPVCGVVIVSGSVKNTADHVA